MQINNTYGQRSAVTPISDESMEYALNLAAANIVLLVGMYKRGRKFKKLFAGCLLINLTRINGHRNIL